jgi:hypothetical protein
MASATCSGEGACLLRKMCVVAEMVVCFFFFFFFFAKAELRLLHRWRRVAEAKRLQSSSNIRCVRRSETFAPCGRQERKANSET